MKSFKSTAWILPQPVLIIGTYDKGGACDVDNITGGYQFKYGVSAIIIVQLALIVYFIISKTI